MLPASISLKEDASEAGREPLSPPFERNLVFALGVASLLFVPVFKVLTGLPPYMGMLLSLGLMWVITEFVHADKDEADGIARSSARTGWVPWPSPVHPAPCCSARRMVSCSMGLAAKPFLITWPARSSCQK
jgi:hypothetical protein